MQKIIFRTIGLCALISGIVLLAINMASLSKLITIQNIIIQVMRLVSDCFLIFGGFQLLKLKEIGHKSLKIYFCSQIPATILVLLNFGYSLFSSEGIEAYSQISVAAFTSFYIFCAISLILLFIIKYPNELVVEDHPQWRLVARLLSLLLPGLGRALVSNLLAGIVLFYVYTRLMSQIPLTDGNLVDLSWLGQLIYYLVVWAIFSLIDWSVVKHFGTFTQESMDSAPESTPGQVSGG